MWGTAKPILVIQKKYCFQVTGSAFYAYELETVTGMVFTEQHCFYKVYKVHNGRTVHFYTSICTMRYHHLH